MGPRRLRAPRREGVPKIREQSGGTDSDVATHRSRCPLQNLMGWGRSLFGESSGASGERDRAVRMGEEGAGLKNETVGVTHVHMHVCALRHVGRPTHASVHPGRRAVCARVCVGSMLQPACVCVHYVCSALMGKSAGDAGQLITQRRPAGVGPATHGGTLGWQHGQCFLGGSTLGTDTEEGTGKGARRHLLWWLLFSRPSAETGKGWRLGRRWRRGLHLLPALRSSLT